jgi:tetratricopeptide (TPR) repeat protein
MTTLANSFNKAHFDEQTDHFCKEALGDFKQVTKGYALFHITFFSIGILELAAFVLFFSFFTKTTMLAFSLAGIFLSLFTYFVLLFYLQAKKPQQLLDVRSSFLLTAQKMLPFSQGSAEIYLGTASALQKMLTSLHRQEYAYYSLPASFETLSPLMQKFSVWTHWKDLYQMKELLLLLIIKQRIELVKLEPSDLEAHARLADAYLALSRLHMDPRKLHPNEDHPWVSPEYNAPEMLEKFKKAALCAVEEYKILNAYAPNDPWVHAQLADIYRTLDLPLQEIQEYEAILKTSSANGDILLRLGTLYFEHGASAQALRLYEVLKEQGDDSKAEELIASYGSALIDEYSSST